MSVELSVHGREQWRRPVGASTPAGVTRRGFTSVAGAILAVVVLLTLVYLTATILVNQASEQDLAYTIDQGNTLWRLDPDCKPFGAIATCLVPGIDNALGVAT